MAGNPNSNAARVRAYLEKNPEASLADIVRDVPGVIGSYAAHIKLRFDQGKVTGGYERGGRRQSQSSKAARNSDGHAKAQKPDNSRWPLNTTPT